MAGSPSDVDEPVSTMLQIVQAHRTVEAVRRARVVDAPECKESRLRRQSDLGDSYHHDYHGLHTGCDRDWLYSGDLLPCTALDVWVGPLVVAWCSVVGVL